MTDQDSSLKGHLHSLKERTKELNCLYTVEELLSQEDLATSDILSGVAQALPPGWQFPEICCSSIDVGPQHYSTHSSVQTVWSQSADINVQGSKVGAVTVCYTEEKPEADEGPFLKEERKLINAIAGHIGLYLTGRSADAGQHNDAKSAETNNDTGVSEWKIIHDFLRRADQPLLATITRKMINYLYWTGVTEATSLLKDYLNEDPSDPDLELDDNRPSPRGVLEDIMLLADRTFEIAEQHCSEEEIFNNIRTWINEDKAATLVEALESGQSSLSDISTCLDRFKSSELTEHDFSKPLRSTLTVSLLRRFFSDNLTFLRITKDRVRVSDFHRLIRRIIYSPKSKGRLGGKSTGLFLARTLLRSSPEHRDVFDRIKIPKTWYISSDSMLEFIRYNKLDDVFAYKYQDIERIRKDYPHLIQVFKNSQFPVELANGVAVALDEFGEHPLIVRSSSRLEDQIGAAFSGKYKSLFVANQGTKKARLAALLDAVAEVYASILSPDAIEYRAERGMLDVHEEMAVMIQEVVGVRVGKYFLPSFAGVAFSRNEFRWSPRINRKDGLVRIVPGLGTRAVDRLSDDYPVMLAPGQPGLRVNVTVDEVIRYSPKQVDVIDLEANDFKTVSMRDLLEEVGDAYPMLKKVVSVASDDMIRPPKGLAADWKLDDVFVTFGGLIEEGSFTNAVRSMLEVLSSTLGYPVDIEFASDGVNLYLLQCRAQSASIDSEPAPIPRNLPPNKVVFTANRYISNGRVPEITHIVYVVPEAFAALPDIGDLKDVARAVGKLNKILPRRQFVLIGPGRWGSRGDVKLGVSVTYGDINNTAVLMEVAWKKGTYVPDLSFGTHFFQDLVEADIRYLPLYPEDDGVVFNEPFLVRSESILREILPEYAHLDHVLRVIDVSSVTNGQILKILLNADLDQAIGMLSLPSVLPEEEPLEEFRVEQRSENHWRWRMLMAEKIASSLDYERFSVKGLYVIGSAKNATSGPGSDLDLIVHFDGNEAHRELLSLWLDGWSRSLAEVNYLRTGYRTDHLLDVHFVSDEDIRNQTSFAVKIGAVTDAARPLSLGKK